MGEFVHALPMPQNFMEDMGILVHYLNILVLRCNKHSMHNFFQMIDIYNQLLNRLNHS